MTKCCSKNWEVPPGMDAEYVKRHLPTPEDVISHFEDKIGISKRNVGEIAFGNQDDLDVPFKTELIVVRRLDAKWFRNKYPEIANKSIEFIVGNMGISGIDIWYKPLVFTPLCSPPHFHLCPIKI